MQTTNPCCEDERQYSFSSDQPRKKGNALLLIIVGSAHVEFPELFDIGWFPLHLLAGSTSPDRVVVAIRFALLCRENRYRSSIFLVSFVIVHGFVILQGTMNCRGAIGTRIRTGHCDSCRHERQQCITRRDLDELWKPFGALLFDLGGRSTLQFAECVHLIQFDRLKVMSG